MTPSTSVTLPHRPSGSSRLGAHGTSELLDDYDGFLTPTDLDYWNPFVNQNRLTSPFGTSTRIVCTSFHGVLLDCWQADRQGNPHKLVQLPRNYPGSTGSSQPGGGPSRFVYPGFIPGI
ncbi:hypothetical protein [Rhodococcus spongiicola]|uniref:hypothetical protein n=1 Tax=Rhodococcus spongiicola TaxID=2487352 RepID=UPI0026D37F0F